MASLLDLVINHIALPPTLPGRADLTINAIDRDIVARLIASCRTARDATTDHDLIRLWDDTRYTLQTCKQLNDAGRLREDSLKEEFGRLKPGGLLILHVREQNAGLIIHRYVSWVQQPIMPSVSHMLTSSQVR